MAEESDSALSLASAEQFGRELFERVNAQARVNPRSIANFSELRAAVSSGGCDGFEYDYYLVAPDGMQPTIYVIGSLRQKDTVLIGRHFAAPVNGDAADLTALRTSTRGCLILPLTAETVALTVTHVLSQTPSEFHVFANLKYGVSIYVGTADRLWAVENGTIRLANDPGT